MKKLPIICPSCEASLRVSSLSCTRCETLISGSYSLPMFLKLAEEDQDFIMDFVLLGGSLKAMAKQMDRSYPTVRNKLDNIIEELNKFMKNDALKNLD